MNDGILSPAFLQAACAHQAQEQPTVITLKALQADPTITSVTCVGEITISSIKGGVETTQTYNDLTATPVAVEADDQSQFTITGADVTIDTLGTECELVTE